MGGQNKRETYSDWLAGWLARNTKMLQMVLVPIANDALTPIYKAIFFLNFVFKNGPLWVNCFLHFSSLNTVFNAVDSKYYCQWLDSNHGSLVLEATTQPTVPQPICSFYPFMRFEPRHDGMIEICFQEIFGTTDQWDLTIFNFLLPNVLSTQAL